MIHYCENDPCEFEATHVVVITDTLLCRTCAQAYEMGRGVRSPALEIGGDLSSFEEATVKELLSRRKLDNEEREEPAVIADSKGFNLGELTEPLGFIHIPSFEKPDAFSTGTAPTEPEEDEDA